MNIGLKVAKSINQQIYEWIERNKIKCTNRKVFKQTSKTTETKFKKLVKISQ